MLQKWSDNFKPDFQKEKVSYDIQLAKIDKKTKISEVKRSGLHIICNDDECSLCTITWIRSQQSHVHQSRQFIALNVAKKCKGSTPGMFTDPATC